MPRVIPYILLLLGLCVTRVDASSEATSSNPAAQHGIATFGQLKYPAGFKNFSYVNPAAPKGGEVRMAALGTFDTLNPFIIKGTPTASVARCYATLLSEPGDAPGETYGYVAESLVVAPDRSWVVFNLNPAAKFNNGQMITADDVVFSFNVLREKGLPLFRTYFKAVTKVEKISIHQVKFYFSDNKSRELPLVLGQLPVLAKSYYETHEFNETTLTPPPSSGPYEVAHLKPGRSVTLKRVKNWWAENIPSQKGLYNFDVIRLDYYRDTNAMFEAFKNGQVDVRFENSAKLWTTSYNFPAIKQGLVKKELIKHSLPYGSYGLYFNTRRELFSDVKVRRAITEMFNFYWANKNLFYGQYKRNQSYFPNTELAATGLPKGEEKAFLEQYKDQLPAEVFTTVFSLPEHKSERDIRQSRDKAFVLLKEADWEIKGQKLVHKKTGKPFEFEFLVYDQAMEKVALHLQGYLKQLGMEMKVRLVDASTYQERYEKQNFDMISHIVPQGPIPGNEQRGFWSSQSADMIGSRNIAGVKSKVVDDIVEKLIESPDYKTLMIRTHALDRVLLWGYYMIPAWHRDDQPVAYWDRFAKPGNPQPYNPLSLDAWWIDKEKEKRLPANLQRAVIKEEDKQQLVQPLPEPTKHWWQRLWDWVMSWFGK